SIFSTIMNNTYMRHLKYIIILLVFLAALIVPSKAYALSYDLIPPSGELIRDQNVQFIIDIDTEGTSVTTAQVGLTYDTQYLQYVSTTPGDAMNSISATPNGTNALILNGT